MRRRSRGSCRATVAALLLSSPWPAAATAGHRCFLSAGTTAFITASASTKRLPAVVVPSSVRRATTTTTTMRPRGKNRTSSAMTTSTSSSPSPPSSEQPQAPAASSDSSALGAAYLSALRPVLSSLGDAKRAQWWQRYMKSSMPYYGVPMPEARKACVHLLLPPSSPSQEVVDNDAGGGCVGPPRSQSEYNDAVVHVFTHAQRREEWYAGLELCLRYPQYMTMEAIPTYLHIIHITRWWDVVDVVAPKLIGAVLLGKEKKEVRALSSAWVSSDNLWVRRTAIIMQLKYKERTDTKMLADCIKACATEQEFFIRKAIGWALREYAYTDPHWVRSFVREMEGRGLSALSVREALKRVGAGGEGGEGEKGKRRRRRRKEVDSDDGT